MVTSTIRNKQNLLRQRERGASEVFILIMMTALLAFAGLSYDAGMAFNARRQAANIAASAARSGANTVSTNALYSEGVPRLSDGRNGPSAESIAAQAVNGTDATLLEVYRTSDFELYVKTELVHETTFLGIVGLDSLTVEGEATALVESRAGR